MLRSHRLVIAALITALALAMPAGASIDGNPRLLKDIDGDGDSYPSEFIRAGDRMFFAAEDRHGVELRVSDGTRAGTGMVRDIRRGEGDGIRVLEGVARKGRLFFNGRDSVHGHELWTSDGTREGTRLLKDVRDGAFGSRPSNLTRGLGLVWFGAHSGGEYRADLWVSDGTRAGTRSLMDVSSGADLLPADPHEFTVAGGRMYFIGVELSDDEDYLTNLWASDGTAEGTRKVQWDPPGTTGPTDVPDPLSVTALGDRAVFSVVGRHPNVQKGLWVTDGTVEGTGPISDIDAGKLVTVRDRVFFLVDQGNDSALGVSDGTPGGTHEVEKPRLADVVGITPFGRRVVFRGRDAAHGGEPWVSDGTSAGTRMVKDVHPGERRSLNDGVPFMAARGRVFFEAADGAHGRELWVTDGTRSGTHLVEDIHPGGHSYPGWLGRGLGRLWFSANDGVHGQEPWKMKLP